MRKYIIIILTTLSVFSLTVYADGAVECKVDSLPAEPAMLNRDTIGTVELEVLSNEMDSYMQQLEDMRHCYEHQQFEIDPESADFEQQFAVVSEKLMSLNTLQMEAIEKFNHLIENVTIPEN